MAGVLLIVGAGGTAMASTTASQLGLSATAAETFRATVARVDNDGGVTTQQFLYCEWAWGAEWTAGNPTELVYYADFWCAPDPTGPAVVGSIWASLIGENDEILHEAPVENVLPLDPFATASEGATLVDRPSTQHVLSSSELVLEPLTPGAWVWLLLPEGCEGAGTPVAFCDIHFDEFTIPG
jgi:hypothetical protein